MVRGRIGLVPAEGGNIFTAGPYESDSAYSTQAAELNTSRQVSVHGKYLLSLSRLPVCLHSR